MDTSKGGIFLTGVDKLSNKNENELPKKEVNKDPWARKESKDIRSKKMIKEAADIIKGKYYKNYPNLPSLDDKYKPMMEEKPKEKKKRKKETDKKSKKDINNDDKLTTVKNFFTRNETEIEKIDKNFRNLNPKTDSKNAQFSKTFFKERKERIEDSLKHLYDKERDKINEKLKKLEKQKLFKNEIEKKQKQLNVFKKQHNELIDEIEGNKKKLVDLDNHFEKLRAKYDDSKHQEKVTIALMKIEKIDMETENEKFTTKSLKHMLSHYKSDILKIKMKVERWKDIMKKLQMEKHELSVTSGRLHKWVMDLLADLRLKEAQSKEHSVIQGVFNQDVEDELCIYEDRITLGKIEEHERALEVQKEKAKKQRVEELALKNEEEEKNKSINEKKKHKQQKVRLSEYEQKIDKMLKLMKISNPMSIKETYTDLMYLNICFIIQIR